MNKIVIIHYHEIALKGGNRDFFERKLVENLKKILSQDDYEKVQNQYGRVLVFLKDGIDENIIRQKIKKVFGIANFAFGNETVLDEDLLKEKIWESVKEIQPSSFRVTVQRSNKNFSKTSQEMGKELGAFLYDKFGGKVKVDLKNPELNCFVEIADKNFFFYFNKEKGYAGLPVGTAGKVVSLISSGFDSPVASWKMMRRGCKIVFIHFHSYPYTKKESYENVKEIARILNEYQFGSKVYMAPLAEIQKEISIKAPSKDRIILYRRFMLRIAEKIAKKEDAKALITGDSLAQVASQTLDNIFVISEATKMPILRPLIGENKNDIIDTAREIGTYEISSKPYEDCCSLFVPDRPETHGELADILKVESVFDVENMVNDAIEKSEIIKI